MSSGNVFCSYLFSFESVLLPFLQVGRVPAFGGVRAVTQVALLCALDGVRLCLAHKLRRLLQPHAAGYPFHGRFAHSEVEGADGGGHAGKVAAHPHLLLQGEVYLAGLLFPAQSYAAEALAHRSDSNTETVG